MTAPIEISESRSVGNRPVGTIRASPCRRATPHDRHTCAHSGLARPQLKQSTVSSVIGRAGVLVVRPGWRRKPSTQVAAGGENADGR